MQDREGHPRDHRAPAHLPPLQPGGTPWGHRDVATSGDWGGARGAQSSEAVPRCPFWDRHPGDRQRGTAGCWGSCGLWLSPTIWLLRLPLSLLGTPRVALGMSPGVAPGAVSPVPRVSPGRVPWVRVTRGGTALDLAGPHGVAVGDAGVTRVTPGWEPG